MGDISVGRGSITAALVSAWAEADPGLTSEEVLRKRIPWAVTAMGEGVGAGSRWLSFPPEGLQVEPFIPLPFNKKSHYLDHPN